MFLLIIFYFIDLYISSTTLIFFCIVQTLDNLPDNLNEQAEGFVTPASANHATGMSLSELLIICYLIYLQCVCFRDQNTWVLKLSSICMLFFLFHLVFSSMLLFQIGSFFREGFPHFFSKILEDLLLFTMIYISSFVQLNSLLLYAVFQPHMFNPLSALLVSEFDSVGQRTIDCEQYQSNGSAQSIDSILLLLLL